MEYYAVLKEQETIKVCKQMDGLAMKKMLKII